MLSDDIREKDQSSRRKFIGQDENELKEYSGECGLWLPALASLASCQVKSNGPGEIAPVEPAANAVLLARTLTCPAIGTSWPSGSTLRQYIAPPKITNVRSEA